MPKCITAEQCYITITTAVSNDITFIFIIMDLVITAITIVMLSLLLLLLCYHCYYYFAITV